MTRQPGAPSNQRAPAALQAPMAINTDAQNKRASDVADALWLNAQAEIRRIGELIGMVCSRISTIFTDVSWVMRMGRP